MDTPVAVAYEQGRDLVQDGDVLFIANKKGIILPFLIRWSTKSLFSHTAIAFWMDTVAGKRLMAVQAQGGDKRFIKNVSALNKCEIYVMSSPKAWADVAPQALVKLDQVKYNYFEAFYVGLREFLMTRFNITIKNIDFPGEICSEFNARVLDMPEVEVTPQELFEEVSKTQTLRAILINK